MRETTNGQAATLWGGVGMSSGGVVTGLTSWSQTPPLVPLWVGGTLSVLGMIVTIAALVSIYRHKKTTDQARVYTVRRLTDGLSETWSKERLDTLDPTDRDLLFSGHRDFREWYDRECWKELERYTRRGRFLLVRWYRSLFPHPHRPTATPDERDGDVGLWFGGTCIAIRQGGGVFVVFTRLTLSSGLLRDCSLRLSLWMQRVNGDRTTPKYVTSVPPEVMGQIRRVITEDYEVDELPPKIDLEAFNPKRKKSEEPKCITCGYAGFFLTEEDLRLLGRWRALPEALTRGAHLLVATDLITGSIVGKFQMEERRWWSSPVIST
jgi:hypothetical protein